MTPGHLSDRYITRATGLLTRRGMLRGLGMAGGAAALVVPARARASISALMCPPQAGSFGGGGLGASGPAGAGAFVDGDEDYSAAVPDDGPGMRRLKITNPRTGETYDREFVQNGEYVQEAIDEFSNFARDWRTGDVKPYDPKALDIAWKVWRMLGVDTPFSLTSGYRSPKTNASLNGTAKNSYHMRGKAMDLQNSSVRPSGVQKAGMTLYAGGVGHYDTFTHLDSGPKRNW